MRASTAVAVLSLVLLGISQANAQHHSPEENAAKKPAKTDSQLIASAMSAAPAAISRDATIVAVTDAGKLRVIREGKGMFTCLPDDPATPGKDPMCLDKNGMEWFKALLAKEPPPQGKLWFAYMLVTGSDASNEDPFASEPPKGKKWIHTGPHVMIGGPGITKMMDAYPRTADNTKHPYIMFPGTPYEHIMLPVK